MKWEYHIILTTTASGKGLKEDLNRAGRDGWELVWVIPFAGEHERAFAIFKRPVPEAK